jgi:hypothetical protein
MALLPGYVISILLLFAAGLTAQEQTPSWSKKPSQSVFVVAQNHYTEGLSPEGPTPRFGDLIMIEIFAGADGGYKPASSTRSTPGVKTLAALKSKKSSRCSAIPQPRLSRWIVLSAFRKTRWRWQRTPEILADPQM